MAFNYAKAAETALRLVKNFGGPISIRRLEKDYDEITGQAQELVKLQGTIQGVVLPIASTPKGIFTEADNNLMEALIAGKLRFVLAAAKGAPFEPVANDVLNLGTETFTVVGCTPLAPSGVALLYKIAVTVTPAAPTNEDTVEIVGIEDAGEEFHEVVNEELGQ